MTNELIFLLHTTIIGFATLGALKLGKEALIGFICLACILANLFVIKQTTLFGLTATCADAFMIGAVLGLNVLNEYYGKKAAQKAVWVSFFLLLFYAIMSQIHLAYIPATVDRAHPYYQFILQAMPRITIASFLVYLGVQQWDCLFFAFLKRIFGGKFLLARTTISLLISQLLDTVLFSFLGLYGIIENIGQIIVVSYTVKVAAILISTPFVLLSKRIMRP